VGTTITRQSLYFVDPRQVTIQKETIDRPGPGQLLVRTLASAISPGTELLIYRGHVSSTMPLDESLAALGGTFSYPFKYGYATVGEVIELGADVPARWHRQQVFAFQPHQSHFIATPDALLPLPAGISPQDALFLPNVETAVNLVMDGGPLIGEQVVIFGQGIVGLLTTALLARFPLTNLVTIDPYDLRRQASLTVGAHSSLAPAGLDPLQAQLPQGADLIYELSGNPAALDQAITLAGFDSRIIVGSWYGTRPVTLDLGSRFHRQRVRLISSQVSTVAPPLQGRWSQARRLELAWHMLSQIQPARFITHQIQFSQAAQAYRLLDQTPEQAIQVVLQYRQVEQSQTGQQRE